MNDPLPGEFDLIVIGTGLTESIIAAAASRIGKSVLHIDPNDFYGGYWASFNLTSLSNYGEKCKNLQENEISTPFNNYYSKLLNVKEYWNENIQVIVEQENETVENSKEKALKEFRKFNIDLTPKLLFSRGSLVELLMSSNISRYVEFRALDHILTIIDDKLKAVPSSRADVFSSKELNVVEKRLLMKLLTSCINLDEKCEEAKSYDNKSFLEYLQQNQLTPKLIHYILYAIAMGNEKMTFQDGIRETKKYLSCLGRYGNSPFLFPMYGCGEIPQCFCRLCAVFGGTYCLQRPVNNFEFITDENKRFIFHSLKCFDQNIIGKNIVFGNGVVNEDIFSLTEEENKNLKDHDIKCGGISRGIIITSAPVGEEELNKGGGGVSFLKLYADDKDENGAMVYQLSHFSGTCPKDYYLFHIICETKTTAETDLKPYIDKIFKNQLSIIYSFFFDIPRCIKCCSNKKTLPSNIYLACGPVYELDYDLSIEEGRKIFSQIYPEEEFLPRAPDPDQIIFGDDDEDNDVHEVKEEDCESVKEVKEEDFLKDVTEDEAIEAKEEIEKLNQKVTENLKI